jgi:hypothetical protein
VVGQTHRRRRILTDALHKKLCDRSSIRAATSFCEGKAVGPLLEDANDRMFGAVRAVTAFAESALRYTTQQGAAPFSVRQWIRQGGTGHSGGRGGVLFIPYKAGEIAALRSATSSIESSRYSHLAPLALILGTISLTSSCASLPASPRLDSRGDVPTLNSYVLQAVEMIDHKYSGLGYANEAFTHDVMFGNQGTIAASKKPLTMCVAAQLEVLVEALNLQASESHDYRAFTFLPKSSWERTRPSDFRGQVWIVAGAGGYGIADALSNFGMGARRSFEQLKSGDFVNFNRTNGTGHGAVFINYLDKDGKVVDRFGETVAGFKYSSSQGRGAAGGLGYRYAFFPPSCPTMPPSDGKRDCGVIRSLSARLLNGGSGWLPSDWIHARADEFLATHRTRDERDGTLDVKYFTGLTTDD